MLGIVEYEIILDLHVVLQYKQQESSYDRMHVDHSSVCFSLLHVPS